MISYTKIAALLWVLAPLVMGVDEAKGNTPADTNQVVTQTETSSTLVPGTNPSSASEAKDADDGVITTTTTVIVTTVTTTTTSVNMATSSTNRPCLNPPISKTSKTPKPQTTKTSISTTSASTTSIPSTGIPSTSVPSPSIASTSTSSISPTSASTPHPSSSLAASPSSSSPTSPSSSLATSPSPSPSPDTSSSAAPNPAPSASPPSSSPNSPSGWTETLQVKPHDMFSSSIGVVGCKINTDRVAYLGRMPGCDNMCLKFSYEGRSTFLLHIDQSAGSSDIAYDAWNYLTTGKSATSNPTMGGAVPMQVSVVSMDQCGHLILSGDGSIGFMAGSPNFVNACPAGSYVKQHYQLWNYANQCCSLGADAKCDHDAATGNPSQQCGGTSLGVTTVLKSTVKNTVYGTGQQIDCV